MINSSINPTRLGAQIFWDPYGSNASLRPTQRGKPSLSFGNTSLAMKDHAYRAVSSVSSPSMRSRAQSGMGPHSQRSSRQTTPGRFPSKTVLRSESPQKSEISSIPQIRIRRSVTFPRATRNAYLDPQSNAGPSRAQQSQNRDALRKDEEESQRATQGTFEGGTHDEDEDSDGEESSDDNDSDNEEDETEGEDPSPDTHHTSPGLSTQGRPRTALPAGRQSFILLPETNGLPQIVVYPVPQGHPKGPPSATHSSPTRPSPPEFDSPAPDTRSLRTVSSSTPRIRPQRVPEVSHFPSPDGYSGDEAGTSIGWGEGSEAGVPERRSQYSQQSSSSAARSIWLEQQVAIREEEAARREEEARLKEDDARGLEIAARKAFAWVQNLEARTGRIHDAALQAEARAKRMDAEIWKREAEVLRQQAEIAKREAVIAKREIAVQRAEQEVRRKEREARRKEEELLLKEGTVRDKEQEALRMGEEVQRKRKKTEIKQSGKKLSKRRAAEDQGATKDIVTAAWGKLKRRITQAHKQKQSRTLPHKHDEFDGDGTVVGTDPYANQDVELEGSTWVFVPAPRSRKVEQWLKTTFREDQQEPESMSHVVTSELQSSSGPSSQ